MSCGESGADRNQEAPFTNFDLGVTGCDFSFDVNSPRFQRERSPAPGDRGSSEMPEERRARPRRLLNNSNPNQNPGNPPPPFASTPCHNSPMISDQISSPNSTIQSSQTNFPKDYLPRLKIFAENFWKPVTAGILFAFILSYLLVYLYAQDLDKLMACPKTRYQAAAYKEHTFLYYLCRLVRSFKSGSESKKSWR